MKNTLIICIVLFFTTSLTSQTELLDLKRAQYLVSKSTTTCNIPITNIPATGPTTCDGTLIFDFSACADFPYDILFNSASCSLPSGVSGITSPTYTLTGLCPCSNFDIFIFDNNSNMVFYSGSNAMPYLMPTLIRETNKENHITIYPNPSSDILIVKSEKNFNRTVLKSFNGIIVKEIVKDVNELIVDLDNLSNGLYFIEVYNSQELLNTKKVVLQK